MNFCKFSSINCQRHNDNYISMDCLLNRIQIMIQAHVEVHCTDYITLLRWPILRYYSQNRILIYKSCIHINIHTWLTICKKYIILNLYVDYFYTCFTMQNKTKDLSSFQYLGDLSFEYVTRSVEKRTMNEYTTQDLYFTFFLLTCSTLLQNDIYFYYSTALNSTL